MDAKIVGVLVLAAVVGGAAGAGFSRIPNVDPAVCVLVACVGFVVAGALMRPVVIEAVARDPEVRAWSLRQPHGAQAGA